MNETVMVSREVKTLDQALYPLEIISELGMEYVNPTSKQKRRVAMFKCSGCGSVFRVQVANVKIGRTKGCNACAKKAAAKTRALKAGSKFEAKARGIHGDKYDYSGVNYVTAHIKVSIMCNNCNTSFTQPPNAHLAGRGCSMCSSYSDYDAIYIWQVNDTDIYKIGVTSTRLNDKRIQMVAKKATRLVGVNIIPNIIILKKVDNALELEKELHRMFTVIPHSVPQALNGSTEFKVLNTAELKAALKMIEGQV